MLIDQSYIYMKKAGVRMKYLTKLTCVLFLLLIFMLSGLSGCTHMKYKHENNVKEEGRSNAVYDNLTHPETCVEQWRQNLISSQEAVNCIDTYMRANNTTSNIR